MGQQALIAKYEGARSLYEQFAETVRQVIVQAARDRGLKVQSVDFRAKGIESLRSKLLRADPPYSELVQVTDLAGVRAIVYFPRDVDKVVEIAETFSVDRENTVDKRKNIDPERFGYSSVHYVVSLDDIRAKQVEYRRFAGLKCEVQIRTILQHAWAEIEHDIGYKAQIDIPVELRRRFSVLSGLLELADREFEAIRKDEEVFRKTVAKSVEEDRLTIPIDMVSLREYLKGREIGGFKLAEIGARDLSELIAEMVGIGIPELKALDDAIRGFDLDLREFEAMLRKIRPGLGLHPAGVIRIVLAKAHPKEFRQVMDKEMLRTSGPLREFNRQLTEAILQFVSSGKDAPKGSSSRSRG